MNHTTLQGSSTCRNLFASPCGPSPHRMPPSQYDFLKNKLEMMQERFRGSLMWQYDSYDCAAARCSGTAHVTSALCWYLVFLFVIG
jgi:hypothetical protein